MTYATAGADWASSFQGGADVMDETLSSIAAGKALQGLQALNQQPMPGTPQTMPGYAPSPPGYPMAGSQGGGAPPPQAQPQNQPLMGLGTRITSNPAATYGGTPNFAQRFPTSGQGVLPTPPQPPVQQGAGPPGQPPPMPPQQQQQPMGQPQGQQGGPLSIQQAIAAIQKSNPGAPPNVIFGALKKLAPLIQQDQLQAFRQFEMGMGPGSQSGGGGQQNDALVDAIGTYRQQPLSMSWRNPFNRNIMEQVYHKYPDYDSNQYFARRAGETTTGRIEAQTQPLPAQQEGGQGGSTLQSRQSTERAFAPNGYNGKSVTSFNVVTQHLGLLRQVADALEQGDKGIQTLNRLSTAWQQEFGSPIPTNFDAVKRFVLTELTKAILPGGGAVFDRVEAQDTINRWQTNEQINEGIDQYIGLMGGQIAGQRKSYEAGSGRNDFDQRYLSPATKNLIEAHKQSGQQAPAENDPLGIR
jgi:hypothetical protein